jgi:hypothetical protein
LIAVQQKIKPLGYRLIELFEDKPKEFMSMRLHLRLTWMNYIDANVVVIAGKELLYVILDNGKLLVFQKPRSPLVVQLLIYYHFSNPLKQIRALLFRDILLPNL